MPLIEPLSQCPDCDKLDVHAERFFSRLKTHLDDLGRFNADPRILNSTLFPLKKEIRDTDISRWLTVCAQAGLLRCYPDLKGRPIVEVYGARQSKKKFLRSSYDDPDRQLPLLGAEPPPARAKAGKRENRKVGNEEKRREGKSAPAPDDSENDGYIVPPRPDPIPNAAIPTWAEVETSAKMQGLAPESAKTFYDHHENNNLWFNKYNRLINWPRYLKTWAETDRARGDARPTGHASFHKQTHPDRNAGTHNAGPVGKYEIYAAARETKNS